MRKHRKQVQINILKAELCLQYMITRLRPNPKPLDTMYDTILTACIANQIYIIQSQPIPNFESGSLAMVGNSDKKEIIINK